MLRFILTTYLVELSANWTSSIFPLIVICVCDPSKFCRSSGNRSNNHFFKNRSNEFGKVSSRRVLVVINMAATASVYFRNAGYTGVTIYYIFVRFHDENSRSKYLALWSIPVTSVGYSDCSVCQNRADLITGFLVLPVKN